MEHAIVIPRLDKDGTPVLFLPEISANFGHIVCYVHIGQHSEASLDYYHETKPDKANHCAYLIREWADMGEKVQPIIRRRLNAKWLRMAWNWSTQR